MKKEQQFKHGDRVTCAIFGTKIDDAKISIDKDGTPFICQNSRNGCEADDLLGYEYSWELNHDFTDDDVTDLKLAPKTLDNLEVGDILVKKSGDEVMVLGVCDKIIFISFNNIFNKSCSVCFTADELKDSGYKLKDSEQEVKEMTVKEISEKLGYEVKVVKDKK